MALDSPNEPLVRHIAGMEGEEAPAAPDPGDPTDVEENDDGSATVSFGDEGEGFCDE